MSLAPEGLAGLRTGELVWLNHATFFHVSTLEPTLRDSLLSDLGEGELMLENMLVAHGQAPYAGARQILVGMAEPGAAEQVRVG